MASLSKRVMNQAKRCIHMPEVFFECIKERVMNPNAPYLIFTPEHSNLGDHAIAQAEKRMFDEWGLNVIEVTGKELERRQQTKLLRLMNGRTILVHGGGYLGTLWFFAELLLRDVIRNNPKSKIIILPNTMYYEDTEWGREELQKSIAIYNAHPDLTIFCREEKSYEKAKHSYSNVKLVPDVVMSLDLSKASYERKGCVLCLRSDVEKTRTDEESAIIIEQAKLLFADQYTFHDMCIDYTIPVKNRDQELEKQYDIFKRAELVITDRLHGMIFSAITGTPCIVINSKSPKVRGSYAWLQHLEYIRFCDNVEDISKIWSTMPKGGQTYDNSALITYYEVMKDSIMSAI